MVRDQMIYVAVSRGEKTVLENARGTMSLAGFVRQAAMEKALGARSVDAETSDLMAEIQEVKAIINERNRKSRDIDRTMAEAARVDDESIPVAIMRDKVLSILAQSPPLNLYDLARATGYPEKLVFIVMSKLHETKLVTLDKRTLEYRLVR